MVATVAIFAAIGVALVVALLATRASARTLRLRLARATSELERLQAEFGRFAPAEVVNEIALGRAVIAQKRDVTILFADLQGFTSMSERMDPAVLVEMLSGYFERMNRCIAAHKGHLSKFMGDGLMALFGALDSNPWQSADAAKAALGMREALSAYNVELAKRGLPALTFGVGVHRGTVVAGVIGSERLSEFTVIGDAVNVAARIESLTRQAGHDLLLSAEARASLDGAFVVRELPPMAVKGKREPITTFALIELRATFPSEKN